MDFRLQEIEQYGWIIANVNKPISNIHDTWVKEWEFLHHGNLKVLKYLNEHGCPLNENCENASML